MPMPPGAGQATPQHIIIQVRVSTRLNFTTKTTQLLGNIIILYTWVSWWNVTSSKSLTDGTDGARELLEMERDHNFLFFQSGYFNLIFHYQNHSQKLSNFLSHWIENYEKYYEYFYKYIHFQHYLKKHFKLSYYKDTIHSILHIKL